MKAFLVAGLGFGDEGKGTVTEALAFREKANLVVRYNGGAQAAHNVVTNSGRHHTFSQFGSATFLDRKTYLSRFVLVDPGAIMAEGAHLQEVGVADPYELLFVDRQAPVITPYHRAANRIRELARGGARHGSCGIGVGECMQDLLDLGRGPSGTLVVGDLEHTGHTEDKLDHIQQKKIQELRKEGLLGQAPDELYKLLYWSPKEVDATYSPFVRHVHQVDEEFLAQALRTTNVVFEGAQGILLDQNYGFHPHTTYSDTTWANAHALLKIIAFNGETEHWGVTRTFLTRHGAGPFPTEDKNFSLPNTEYNKLHTWQHGFRAGVLDLMLLQYGIGVLKLLDKIAVTHTDVTPKEMNWVYDEDTMLNSGSEFIWDGDFTIKSPTTLAHQQKLGQILLKAKPVDPQEFNLARIASYVGTPIGLTSAGPKLKDKTWHG